MTSAAVSANQAHTTSSDGDFAEVSMTPNVYELREQPFAPPPDPRFLYMSGTHRLAFASLLRALQANRGIVTLLAQPGLGKTTLLFHTLKSFGGKVATVYLFQAAQTPVDLLRAILTHLGVRAIEETAERLLPQLTDLLTEEHRLGKRVIVVIDEAHDLDASVFDVLSLLSNLESPRGRLIQFILCGQPMLSEKLAAIKSLQAMQRGMPTAHLEPFSAQDTAQYVDHRLRSAGYVRRSPLFTPEAAALVARYSQGSPRSINSLCFEALSIACQDRREQVGADTVREAAATLNLAEAKLEPRQERTSVRPIPAPAVPPVSVKETRPSTMATPAQAPKVERKAQPVQCVVVAAEKAFVPPQPLVPQAPEKPDIPQQLPPCELSPPPMLALVAPVVPEAPQQQIAAQETALAVAALPATATMPAQATKVERKAQPASLALVVAERVSVPPQPATTQALKKPDDQQQLPAPELPLPLVMPVVHLAPHRQIAAPEIALPAPIQPFAGPFNGLEKPTVVPAKLVPAKFAIPHGGFAMRRSLAPLLRGLTIAAVLLLAVTGAIIGLYRTKTSPRLHPATSALHREQPRAIATTPNAAPTPPSSPEHDLKGMDLQSALRALPAKGQRSQQK